jgi:hypothetical protein
MVPPYECKQVVPFSPSGNVVYFFFVQIKSCVSEAEDILYSNWSS